MHFFTKSATFLGFVVSKDGVAPSPSKTEALLKLTAPETLQGVRSCLGNFGTFRRHIPKYAELSRPISELTKGHPVKGGKRVKIVWTPEAQEALDKLKRACADSAVLAFPNYTKGFHLFTDASAKAIGGMVSQEEVDETTKEVSYRPLAFYSRVLNVAELNYPVIDKESLAIV